MKPIRLFWWRDEVSGHGNFGDELSPRIVEMVSGRPVEWAPLETCDLVGIGSVLQTAVRVRRREPIPVWGSGFISSGWRSGRGGLECYALRGPLTAARARAMPDVPLGDPGLLAGRLLTNTVPTRTQLGVVPHYADLAHPVVAALSDQEDTVVISPRLPTEDYINAVSECSLILSSSLHGLVTADSLAIPNRWIQLSDAVLGAGFKFRDYYGALGITAAEPLLVTSPVDLSRRILDDLESSYQRSGREALEERLVGAFPTHLKP